MISTQESIENCSICQNSRKKNFFLAPNNYGHIFGYLGPASKTNIKLLNSVQKQFQRVPSKESTHYVARLKENTNHHHHAPRLKDNHHATRLKENANYHYHAPRIKENANYHYTPHLKEKISHHKSRLKDSAYCQTSRYRESPRPRATHVKESTSEISRLIYKRNLLLKPDKSQKWVEPSLFLYNFKSHNCDDTKMRYDESDTDFEDLRNFKKKTRTRSKKRAPIKKAKPKKMVREESTSTYGAVNLNCPSLDSLSKQKAKKKKKRLDPEDVDTTIRKKRNEKMENMEIKKKCTIDHSTISVDSTKVMTRKSPCRASKCSGKVKNLKHTVKDLFGSMESIQSKKRHGNNFAVQHVDPEDTDLILMPWTKDKSRKNIVHCHKIKKKRSTSSTDLSAKGGRINDGFFDSIDTMKNYGKKNRHFRYDKEDDERLYKLPLCPLQKKISKANNQKTSTKGWMQNCSPKTKEVNQKCIHCKDPKTCGHKKRK